MTYNVFSGMLNPTLSTNHASVVYAVVVRLSQVSVLLKRLNVGSCKRHRLYFSDAEDLGKTRTGSHPTEAPNAGWVD